MFRNLDKSKESLPKNSEVIAEQTDDLQETISEEQDTKTSENKADKIVSYYIIERLFAFNLRYEMAQSLKNISSDVITDEDMKIKFNLLFKIPDIAGRIEYFKRFITIYKKEINEQSLPPSNKVLIERIEYLQRTLLKGRHIKTFNNKAQWLDECENFLKYIYYYFTPQVDFIFLFLLEYLKKHMSEAQLEKLLGDYIVKESKKLRRNRLSINDRKKLFFCNWRGIKKKFRLRRRTITAIKSKKLRRNRMSINDRKKLFRYSSKKLRFKNRIAKPVKSKKYNYAANETDYMPEAKKKKFTDPKDMCSLNGSMLDAILSNFEVEDINFGKVNN